MLPDRVPTQLFDLVVGRLGQPLVSLATCRSRFHDTLALTLLLILLVQGCSTAPRGSRVPTAELERIPVSRVEEAVAVGADPYVAPDRQRARFGGDPRRFSTAGVVPVRVWVHNLGDRDLVIRSAEIMLRLPDGSQRVALSVSSAAERLKQAEEEMGRERSGLASGRWLSPGEAPSELAMDRADILDEARGRVEQNPPVPDELGTAKFTFEAPATAVWLWLFSGNKTQLDAEAIAVFLWGLPVTLSLDLGWSLAKTGYEVIRTRSARQAWHTRLDRDRTLGRLEDVELGSDESASAVLYFPMAPSDVRVVSDAVLTVRFADVEGEEEASVHLPLGPSKINRAPAEDRRRDFTLAFLPTLTS